MPHFKPHLVAQIRHVPLAYAEVPFRSALADARFGSLKREARKVPVPPLGHEADFVLFGKRNEGQLSEGNWVLGFLLD